MIAGAATIFLSSCDDFLTKEDPNKVDAPSYFRNEIDLQTYANGFLENMLPTADDIATGDQHSDYLGWRGAWNYLMASYDADDQGSWTWTNLRNINYYLDNMGRAEVSNEKMLHYEGVGRFWRAYFYFGKVKTFGAVPWYEHVIDSEDNASLYKGRDSREEVMRNVLNDINYACDNCITSTALEVNSVQITKYVALAMKARICLYEGTFRKYHKVDPSTGKPWIDDESEMYLKECVKACEALMNAGRYQIVSSQGNVQKQYRELFTSEKVNTTEDIWACAYSGSLSVVHHLNSKFIVQQYGSFAILKQFVDTYLMLDGTPFTSSADYGKKQFSEEFAGRDWRMRQTMRHPGYKRMEKGAEVAKCPDFNFSSSGYQPIKWTLDDTALDGNTSPCNSSIPIIRYAEVLLDYAEAKAELGEMTENVWNQTIKVLRERAGVTSIYPTAADPYMVDYFLGTVTDPVILEVRRERGIELFMENLRWDDCMRWRVGELLERLWLGIYVPAMNTEYDLDGDGTPDVSFVTKTPANPTKNVQYRIIGSEFELTEGTSGNLVSYRSIERAWDNKKYVRPVPTTALNVNPNLGQNPGWEK